MSIAEDLKAFQDATSSCLHASKFLMLGLQFLQSDESLPEGNLRTYREGLGRAVRAAHMLPGAGVLLVTFADYDAAISELWDTFEDGDYEAAREALNAAINVIPSIENRIATLAGFDGLDRPDMPVDESPDPLRWSDFHEPSKLQRLAKVSATTWRRHRKIHTKHVRKHDSSGFKKVQISEWFASKILMLSLSEFKDQKFEQSSHR